MKTIITIFIFVTTVYTFGQDEKNKKENGTSQETLDATKNNEFSPQIFLGQITSNPTTNNFGVDLTEQAINLKGVFFESKTGAFIAGANIKGNNENKSLGIFGDGNLNGKLSGDLSMTYNFPAKVRYTYKKVGLENSHPSYEKILKDTSLYNVNRQRFKFLTFGVEGSGAKYYLIDSTSNFSEMVQKRIFSGWKFYGQFNILNYYTKRNRAMIHSFRASYGETNNVTDLTEYTISNSSSFTNGSDGKKIERKITGYFDDYFVQHQGIISYELNLYDMDTTALKVGVIAGIDFVYNSKQKNYTRVNAGLNFPVVLTKSGKGARRLYIGAILSTTDPLNWRAKTDFSFENTLSASIRLVSPIKINLK